MTRILVALVALGLSAPVDGFAAHKEGKKTKIKGSRKDDSGGSEFLKCKSGFALVSDRSGGEWPAVAGILDEKDVKGAVTKMNDVRYSCEYNYYMTTECSGKNVLKDDAFGKDYCADKNTLLVLDRKKTPDSKCPSVSGADEKFRQTAGLDICYYYAKPEKKTGASSSTKKSSGTNRSPSATVESSSSTDASAD